MFGSGSSQNYITTMGIVVDVNDPQERGRVRVRVSTWGDTEDHDVSDLPWAICTQPFAGSITTSLFERGPNEGATTAGPVSYGFWGTVKVGAVAIIVCLNGNPMDRICLGFIHHENLIHTLPHGRYIYNSSNGEPDGPLSSNETKIQPLYDNQTNAFGSRRSNYEWRSRGADYVVSALNDDALFDVHATSSIGDDKNTSVEGINYTITQGYAKDRSGASQTTPVDSQTYSWTTPGFHAISMDDRVENCRVKLRTSAGHQIILDDTNERVYINTAEGRNWIELDQDGNIDIYSTKKVSIRTESDLNLSSDKTIRLHGKEGVHMYSGKEVRVQAVEDIHIKTAQNLRTHSTQDTKLQSDGAMHIKSTGNNYIETSGDFNIKSGGAGKITSGGTLNLTGSDVLVTGGQIHFNGPSAAGADAAGGASELPAFWTNRVPAHEPWGRTTTTNPDTNTDHTPKHDYNDPTMGTDDKVRGKYWRR